MKHVAKATIVCSSTRREMKVRKVRHIPKVGGGLWQRLPDGHLVGLWEVVWSVDYVVSTVIWMMGPIQWGQLTFMIMPNPICTCTLWIYTDENLHMLKGLGPASYSPIAQVLCALTDEEKKKLRCKFDIPYSWKIWRGIKFDGLAVRAYNRQIKIRQYFLHAYIRMAILYRAAKFKSANIFARADSRQSAKFNSRQIFRLYGSLFCS